MPGSKSHQQHDHTHRDLDLHDNQLTLTNENIFEEPCAYMCAGLLSDFFSMLSIALRSRPIRSKREEDDEVYFCSAYSGINRGSVNPFIVESDACRIKSFLVVITQVLRCSAVNTLQYYGSCKQLSKRCNETNQYTFAKG